MLAPPPRIYILASVPTLALLLLGLVYNNNYYGVREYPLYNPANSIISDASVNLTPPPQKIQKQGDIQKLFSGVVQPFNASYTDPAGRVYEVPRTLHWTSPLGNRILIVDIDTRIPDGKNELFGQEAMEWATHSSSTGGALVSNAIMDHYLYAQIHGYDYKYYHARPMDGYYNTWIKPHALAALLKDEEEAHQFVVFLDADVTVSHLDVPLEWMFNRWNITARTSISMAVDPETNDWHQPGWPVVSNADSRGELVYNTGFIIAQNLPLTHEMLQAWVECPTEIRYEGCAKWKETWSHEQRAFSEYIRYDFNPDGDNIVPISCDDANAWPDAKKEVLFVESDCHGNFFRHYWGNKEQTKGELQDTVMQLMTQLLQLQVHQNLDSITFLEQEQSSPAAEESQITVR